MSKSNLKSHLTKLVKSARDNEKDQRRWKILFALEELLGRNRRMVYAAIALKVRHKVTRFYHPPPYRPKSIINSVEGWFNDSIPPQIGEGGWVKEIVPEQSMHSKKSDYINDEIQPAFSKYDKSHAFPKAYLCCLKNAKIVIDNGEVISSDDKVFDDFTFECGKSIEGDEVFKSYIDMPQFRREVLATITSIAGAKNYYHWLFDDLPRLKLLEGVIDEIDYHRDMHHPLLASQEGVSLERISFETGSGNPSNWHSAASIEGYATPGRRNSQFRLVDAIDEGIQVEPEIFTPDMDGIDDVLMIRYRFQSPGLIASILIFDPRGRLVREIAGGVLLGTDGFYTWDGCDRQGRRARTGLYLVLSEVSGPDRQIRKYRRTCVLSVGR